MRTVWKFCGINIGRVVCLVRGHKWSKRHNQLFEVLRCRRCGTYRVVGPRK